MMAVMKNDINNSNNNNETPVILEGEDKTKAYNKVISYIRDQMVNSQHGITDQERRAFLEVSRDNKAIASHTKGVFGALAVQNDMDWEAAFSRDEPQVLPKILGDIASKNVIEKVKDDAGGQDAVTTQNALCGFKQALYSMVNESLRRTTTIHTVEDSVHTPTKQGECQHASHIAHNKWRPIIEMIDPKVKTAFDSLVCNPDCTQQQVKEKFGKYFYPAGQSLTLLLPRNSSIHKYQDTVVPQYVCAMCAVAELERDDIVVCSDKHMTWIPDGYEKAREERLWSNIDS